MRAARRWNAKRSRLERLERDDPSAAASLRVAMYLQYRSEVSRRVLRNDIPTASRLVDRVRRHLRIDLRDDFAGFLTVRQARMEIFRRASQLGAPPAWELVQSLRRTRGLDFGDELTDLLQRLIKTGRNVKHKTHGAGRARLVRPG